MITLAGLLLLVVLMVLFVEHLHMVRGVPSIVTRIMTHVLGAAIALSLPILLTKWEAVFYGLVIATSLYVLGRYNLIPSINKADPTSLGAALFPLGLALHVGIFFEAPFAYQAGILVLGFSDPVARLFGTLYPKAEYSITGRKTMTGSLAFFLVSVFVLITLGFFTGLPLTQPQFILAVLSIAGGVTLLEASLGKGFDNIAIAPVTGALCALLL